MWEKQKKIMQWSSLALDPADGDVQLYGGSMMSIDFRRWTMNGIPRRCMQIHRSAISGILSMRRSGIILTGAAEAWLTRCCR